MTSNYNANNYRKERQLRQDLRIPASFLGEIKFNGQTIFGKIEDISLNGAKLRLSIPLPIKSKIELKLTIYHLTLHGVCVWSGAPDWTANSHLAGIRFIELNQEQYAGLRQILFSLAG